jgi:glycosyltransferase involved in cell wall biosynthesis
MSNTNMQVVCILPVHNEESFLRHTLDSFLNQSRRPDKIILVDDGSTDSSYQIAMEYCESNFPLIDVIQNEKSESHLPGSKVVRAFNSGYKSLDKEFDLVCKFDADLIFPENYLERVIQVFEADIRVGIAGGICIIKGADGWVPELVSDQDHVRGPVKAYSKECFAAIGGLREGMGWDTLDELLAIFHGFRVTCVPELEVKHLKPTGASYSPKARYYKGEAFYRMGYGFLLTLIASVKLAVSEKSIVRFFDHMSGFLKAKFSSQSKMVTIDEERFIRKYRWERIRQKVHSRF